MTPSVTIFDHWYSLKNRISLLVRATKKLKTVLESNFYILSDNYYLTSTNRWFWWWKVHELPFLVEWFSCAFIIVKLSNDQLFSVLYRRNVWFPAHWMFKINQLVRKMEVAPNKALYQIVSVLKWKKYGKKQVKLSMFYLFLLRYFEPMFIK